MIARAPVHEPRFPLPEAAKLLHVSVKTLRNWVSDRKIGAFRGRPTLIPASEIERVLVPRWQPAVNVWR